MHKIFIISDKTLTLKHVAKLNKLLYPHHFSLSLFIKAKYRHYLTFCTLLDVQKKQPSRRKALPQFRLWKIPQRSSLHVISLSLSLSSRKKSQKRRQAETRAENQRASERKRETETRERAAAATGLKRQKDEGWCYLWRRPPEVPEHQKPARARARKLGCLSALPDCRERESTKCRVRCFHDITRYYNARADN